jgi:hypothetical protein
MDYDPITKIATWWHDLGDDEYAVEEVQDVEAILEWNRFLRDENSGAWKGDLHQVASIPIVVYERLRKNGYPVDDEEWLKSWLNDPDQEVFRTRYGKL